MIASVSCFEITFPASNALSLIEEMVVAYMCEVKYLRKYLNIYLRMKVEFQSREIFFLVLFQFD